MFYSMIHFSFCPFSPITSLSFSFYSISWNFLAFHFLLLRFLTRQLPHILIVSSRIVTLRYCQHGVRNQMWQQGVSSETLWFLQVWPVVTDQTSDPDWESSLFTKSGWAINDYSTLVLIAPPLRLVLMLLQLRKWPLSSVQTQHSFEVRDTLCAMCNNWAQFRSIECRCVGALLGQFKASSEFDPFWPFNTLQLEKQYSYFRRK